MASTNSLSYTNKTPGGPAGLARVTQRLHDQASLTAALATNDTINAGYIPVNAVVVGATLKAQSQLDSGGSPSLTWDMGVTGSTTLFKSAVSTVGRAVGVSGDTTMTTGGVLYKNTSGGDLAVVITCHAAAATPVAGVLEFEVSYFVEPAAGSVA